MRNRAVLFQQLSDNGVQCICSVKDKCHLLCLALISKYRCSDTVAEVFIAQVVIFRWLFPKYILCPSLPMGTQTAYFWVRWYYNYFKIILTIYYKIVFHLSNYTVLG